MKGNFYDKWLFNKAFEIADSNPIESKARYEEYLKEYSNDYSAYPYYVYVLITLGEFEKAEKVLDYVERAYVSDPSFTYKTRKIKLLKNNIFCDRLKILSYTGRYSLMYKMCVENPDMIKELDINAVDFYAKKKCGLLDRMSRNKHSYLFKQILEYSESEFLEHVKHHLMEHSYDSDTPGESYFSLDFPLDDVILEVKKYLLSDRRIYSGYYQDIYVFKYDGCGRTNNKSVDFFSVIVFHDTMDIITMFPTLEGKNLPYIDLNYMTYNNKNTKVRRMSQIDKFNARFEKK